MRCSKAIKLAFQHEDGEQPADVRQHLAGCSRCSAAVARMQAVRQLVSLKKHEVPDPAFEQRSLMAIHRRLVELNQSPGELPAWGGLGGSPFPALRYIVVGTFAVLAAMQMLSMPPGSASFAPVSAPRVAEGQPFPPPAENAGVAALQVASNRGPGRLEYGPSYLQTVPVNFEY